MYANVITYSISLSLSLFNFVLCDSPILALLLVTYIYLHACILTYFHTFKLTYLHPYLHITQYATWSQSEQIVAKVSPLLLHGRFYYESPGVFTSDQLAEIKQVTLAHLICADADNITEIPKDVFRVTQYPRQYVKCDSGVIPELNLKVWAHCCQGTLVARRNVTAWCDCKYNSSTCMFL